jgi:hypothetical protein
VARRLREEFLKLKAKSRKEKKLKAKSWKLKKTVLYRTRQFAAFKGPTPYHVRTLFSGHCPLGIKKGVFYEELTKEVRTKPNF